MMKKLTDYLSWVAIALVCLALALFVQPWKPDWANFARYFAVAGLVLLLLSLLTGWREIATAMQRRQTRLGTITISSIAVVLGILVLINVIGTRQSKRWDLTTGGVYTLSDQTQNILKKLDGTLTMRVFDEAANLTRSKDQIGEYEHVSAKIKAEYIDVLKRPAEARKYQVQAAGTVVLEYNGRVERVVGSGEQDLTNGIIKVVSGAQKKVYLTQGHGERTADSTDRTGYSTVKASLERENYGVEKIALVQQPQVPADATMLIVAGPKTDL